MIFWDIAGNIGVVTPEPELPPIYINKLLPTMHTTLLGHDRYISSRCVECANNVDIKMNAVFFELLTKCSSISELIKSARCNRIANADLVTVAKFTPFFLYGICPTCWRELSEEQYNNQ
jgi:hypothetical protein